MKVVDSGSTEEPTPGIRRGPLYYWFAHFFGCPEAALVLFDRRQDARMHINGTWEIMACVRCHRLHYNPVQKT